MKTDSQDISQSNVGCLITITRKKLNTKLLYYPNQKRSLETARYYNHQQKNTVIFVLKDKFRFEKSNKVLHQNYCKITKNIILKLQVHFGYIQRHR